MNTNVKPSIFISNHVKRKRKLIPSDISWMGIRGIYWINAATGEICPIEGTFDKHPWFLFYIEVDASKYSARTGDIWGAYGCSRNILYDGSSYFTVNTIYYNKTIKSVIFDTNNHVPLTMSVKRNLDIIIAKTATKTK